VREANRLRAEAAQDPLRPIADRQHLAVVRDDGVRVEQVAIEAPEDCVPQLGSHAPAAALVEEADDRAAVVVLAGYVVEEELHDEARNRTLLDSSAGVSGEVHVRLLG
jgi:hypothetical protein